MDLPYDLAKILTKPTRFAVEASEFAELEKLTATGDKAARTDPANLSPSALADLHARVAAHPEWSGKLVTYP